MKRFGIFGLVILMTGLIFAGCASPEGSSEGSAPLGTQNYNLVPITITPSGTGEADIQIGEDGLGDVIVANGHTVEILNGTSMAGGPSKCTDLGGGDVRCWIRLINRDSDEYMTNAFITGTTCPKCTTAQIDNADLSHGDTTKAIGGAQPSVEITGLGICYAETGVYVARPSPYNEKGCPIQLCPTGASKPAQTIHPKCGARSQMWDFGAQTAQYKFMGGVQATYYQWNALGSDGAPGGVGDDPLYNFQDYTTVYVVLTDLLNANLARSWYWPGAYKRSNHIAGFGSAGNVSDISIPVGRYFAMNLAVEYPNRVEAQPHASQPVFPANGYEYYNMWAVMVRYNPFAIERVKAAKHKIGGVGTNVYPGMPVQCVTAATCTTPGTEAWDHMEPYSEGVNSIYPAGAKEGWVSLYRFLNQNFGRNDLAYTYKFDTVGKTIGFTASVYPILEGGHKGIAHFDKTKAGLVISTAMFGGKGSVAENNWMTQDGADAAPEMLLNMMYMYSIAGSSGRGSEIRVDMFTSYTQFRLWHTGLTMLPGGPKGGTSDDWGDYCAPFSTAFPGTHYCDPGKGILDYALYQGVENAQRFLPLGGQSPAGGNGGVQAWNVFVCVQ